MESVAGKCPHCGGNNLEYGEMVLEGNQAIYPTICGDCHFDYKETYDLVFVGNIIDFEDFRYQLWERCFDVFTENSIDDEVIDTFNEVFNDKGTYESNANHLFKFLKLS